MTGGSNRRLLAGVLVLAATMVLGVLPGPAAAQAEERPAFYEAPAEMPAEDGAVIRSEPLAHLLDPAQVQPVTSTRILYRSTDRTGEPHAVSGSVIVPDAPWSGPGKRPVIGYGVGTQGVGDRCAPSRQFSEGFEYEGLVMAGLLARGYAIAMTDYEGLGTAGMHTYMDRVSQGRAVLDAVRAAQRLPGTGLDGTHPVGLYGYSQGGAAAASAAELAASYAPDLDVRGTVAGAVPADLTELPAALDGGLWAEFAWFAIAGLSASYDVDITGELNEAGREVYDEISDDCVFDLANTAFTSSGDYTADGGTLADLIQREPFSTMVEDQRIGLGVPSAPVLLTHSLADDIIPYRVGRQLARDWCDRGARVRLSTNALPTHLGGMLDNATQVYGFFEARFAGLRAPSSCWRL